MSFGIVVYQGPTKININIAIAVRILNNQTIISNMMMMMTKNPDDIPTGDLPIGISSAHHLLHLLHEDVQLYRERMQILFPCP